MSLLTHAFFQHALLAGTFTAMACGLVGWFLVLRAQVFAGDALSHVAFTGAMAALAYGVDPRLGLFTATVCVALLAGGLGGHGRSGDVVIGIVFSWVLGLGSLFLTLYTTSRGAANGGAGISVLFGSVFGISAGAARTAAWIGGGVSVALVLIARPLLFASFDEAVARARGVPVRVLGPAFLVLVGVCAGEATQTVGSLLLLGLLAAPAGAAHLLTSSPYRGLALACGLAVGETWAGLVLSAEIPSTPPGFAITATAATVYAGAFVYARLRKPVAAQAVETLPEAAPVG